MLPSRLSKLLLVMLLVGLGSSLALAAPVSLYVSPQGNDSWSGRSPATQAPNGPFATLTRAQAAVRALLAASKAPEGVTVWVRGGTYELSQPLVLGPEDSGTPKAPVVYRAYDKEQPRLVGSVKITGWQPWQGKILQVDLKGTSLEKVPFRQLFFGDKRQVMARYPNLDPTDPHFGQWAYVLAADPDPTHQQHSVSDNIAQVKDHFTATSDVIKPTWQQVDKAEVCIHPAYGWAWNIVPLKSADAASGILTLRGNVSYGLMVGDRYFVQNLLAELDAPGEWYLDRATSRLYFFPPVDISQGEVRAPLTQALIQMQRARCVTVRGFIIEQCDGDAVTLKDCESCVIGQSVIRNTGKWAVVISAGHHTGASGNDIYETGSGGVDVSGGDRKTLERGENYATNNYIHHVAVFERTYHTGVNINGVGNLCSHNLIHDCYHQAILMGGNDNIVEYNIVHHTNLGSEDTGGLYMSSRDYTQRGSIIRYNVFHHCGGFGKDNSWSPVRDGKVTFHYPGFTWGIYLDAPEVGMTVFGNVLYDVPVCGMFNHEGRDNNWENNIIIDAPGFQISSGNYPDLDEQSYSYIKALRDKGGYDAYRQHYPELDTYTDDPATRHTCAPGQFARNILYYTPNPGKYNTERRASWNGQLVWTFRGSQASFDGFRFDNNCVYGPAGLTLKFSLTRVPDKSGMLTWDEWRQTGQDAHSVVADPLFVDPAHHDYRLKPDSPALKLGFKPIPFDQIGPYKDDLRATWPVVEAPGVSRLGDFTTHRSFQIPGFEPVPAKEFVPRGGLPNFFAKVKAGQPVTIVSFCGGNHQQGGWLADLMKALRAEYPAVKFTEVNSSIDGGARGSAMSLYRVGYEVLRAKPDLVVVDFIADDGESADSALYPIYEGIIRQIWQADPTTDLLFTHSFRLTYEQTYADGVSPASVGVVEHLADYYGFPTINIGLALAKMARDGRLVLKASKEEAAKLGKPVFTYDGVYVTPAANALYAQTLDERLKQLTSVGTPGPHEVKRARDPHAFDRARQFPITQAMVSGQWEKLPPNGVPDRDFTQHFAEIWTTKTPGAKLTFRFKGTEASLFDLMGPDTGRMQITVDGKDAGVRQQVDTWCYYQRLSSVPLAQGLPDLEHTITIELLADPPDRSAPIAEAKRVNRYKPEAFAGVALRLGWIRVVGEVLP
jgi:hypothetical protein